MHRSPKSPVDTSKHWSTLAKTQDSQSGVLSSSPALRKVFESGDKI